MNGWKIILCFMTEIMVLNAADYEFVFVTGTQSDGGTDAQMYVRLEGTEGEHTFYFDGSGSTFSVGGTDTFERDGPSVGTLGIIAIGHNGAGSLSAWDFERFVITDNYRSVAITLWCRQAYCFVYSFREIISTTPVDPVLDMSQWNAWGVCSPCPSGNRQRYRPCLAEYPQFGLSCITGQTPETITCTCDCSTPTDDGSSKDSTLIIPSGTTIFGADAYYSCNNGKKWSTGTGVLVFRCSENEIWEPISNAEEYAYDHGCINCGSPPTLGEAVYHTNNTVTTIDSEFVVNCSSGKQLPDGSTSTTMKCTWDEGTDSYKWVANTGSMKISVSSNFNWQIQFNGEEWKPWPAPECIVPRPVLGDWEPWSECICETRLQTRNRECIQEHPESTCADASPPESKQCKCNMTSLTFRSNRQQQEGRLLGSKIYSKTTRSSIQCGQLCSLESTCLSFNYNKGTNVCELKKNGTESDLDNFEAEENWTHFFRIWLW